MTARPRGAWVLNFDAEDELASHDGYRMPSVAMRARFAALVDRARPLLGPDDVVIFDGVAIGDAASFVGRAWCPTPSALARLRDARVIVPRAPSLANLRRVNDRRFSAELGQTLPGATFVTSFDECTRIVAARSRDENMLIKRAFGFAGRGRRKVYGGALHDDAGRWLEASLRIGGVQIEPFVAIDREYAIHGDIDEVGALTLGAPTTQRCDDHGAWVSTDLASDDDLSDDERASLDREARFVARALALAGYFGPFGIDAYRWRDAHGVLAFNARGEINARHTMGFGVGMARGRRV